MRNNRGFTLVEIVVTLGISMVMILAIYGMINLSQRSSAGLERRVAAQQDEKTALELMSMEIRMASYNPTATSDLWVPACDGTPAITAYKGIQEATANSITIQMDITDNGVIGESNEVIRYNYDTTKLYITRQTTCGGGAQPFLGAAGGTSTVVKTVNVINNTLGIPVFKYYNGAGTEIFPTAANLTPIPNIRRIEITLAVETENVDPNTKLPKKLIYSTSVIVRNHAPEM